MGQQYASVKLKLEDRLYTRRFSYLFPRIYIIAARCRSTGGNHVESTMYRQGNAAYNILFIHYGPKQT